MRNDLVRAINEMEYELKTGFFIKEKVLKSFCMKVGNFRLSQICHDLSRIVVNNGNHHHLDQYFENYLKYELKKFLDEKYGEEYSEKVFKVI